MKWSPQQDAAMMAVRRWLKNPDKPWFYLAGYAGTGKTTLARELMKDVDGLVLFGAFTGKAAHVLQRKGCENAMTIHSMIYQSKQKGKQDLLDMEAKLARLMSLEPLPKEEIEQLTSLIEREKDALARPAFSLNITGPASAASAICVDEVSMVNEEMGMDLLSFKRPVLVLGDPAQLPPVYGAGFFTSKKPDFMLTEIHRQAQDNPIIRMASIVREGGRLEHGSYGESRVVRYSAIADDPSIAMNAGQILCGRNEVRRSINHRVRELLGQRHPTVPDLPIENDKVVCLRNNRELGILNGGLWRLDSDCFLNEDKVALSLVDDEGRAVWCEAWAYPFVRGCKEVPFYDRIQAQEFDYGYALTVHKAQGSQWDDVLLYDESSVFKDDARKWLYTGITRAAERVTIARG